MRQVLAFGDVLDAADQLSAEDQQELIAILQRRLADAGRERLLASINQSRREFAAGLCKPTTPEEIMREALSCTECFYLPTPTHQ